MSLNLLNKKAFGFKTPDLLNDNPSKAILTLAIPIILLNILKSGFNIVDMFWLGRLGTDYIAGVSASIFMVWSTHGLTALVTVGIVAGISRNIGQNRLETARSNTFQSLKYAAFVGVCLTALLYPLIDPLVDMIELQSVAREAGVNYLLIMIDSCVVTFLVFALQAVSIAWGDTRTPVKITLITFIINVILSPILIFGIGPIPRMETKGAAFATILSFMVASLLYIRIIIKNNWIQTKKTGEEIPFLRYITLGYPVALSSMLFSIVYYFIAKVTANFGSAAIGAMGIGHKIESLPYNFARGFASCVSTFVGRNLGANKPERAVEATDYSIKMVLLFTLIYSTLTIVFATEFISIFNTDPELISHGIDYLLFVMPVEVIVAGQIVIENGTFAGSGYTKPSFYVALPITVLRVPVSWFLAIRLGLGSKGVWLTIALTMALTSIIFWILYRRHKWTSVKI